MFQEYRCYCSDPQSDHPPPQPRRYRGKTIAVEVRRYPRSRKSGGAKQMQPKSPPMTQARTYKPALVRQKSDVRKRYFGSHPQRGWRLCAPSQGAHTGGIAASRDPFIRCLAARVRVENIASDGGHETRTRRRKRLVVYRIAVSVESGGTAGV